MVDSVFIAKRVEAGVPIWDITAYGRDIGTLTDLPCEDSPMATVRYDFHEDEDVTFAAATIRDVLAKVGDYLRGVDADMKAEAEAEYYNEVIGPMKAAEDYAERFAWDNEEPVW